MKKNIHNFEEIILDSEEKEFLKEEIKANNKEPLSPLGRLADILNRSFITYINRTLKNEEINANQIPLLIILHFNEDISQEGISKKLKIDKGSIAKSFKKLEDNEFIKRERDSKDRRKYNLFLTEKGEDIVKRAILRSKKWEETVLKDIDSKRFEEDLKKITAAAINQL